MKIDLRLVMSFLVVGVAACVAPVESGDKTSPEVTAEAEDEIKRSRVCGDSICGKGTYCCNESCGICAPIGGVCTQQVCEPDPGEPCGSSVCGAGTYCCNASCGICAPTGGFCTQQVCSPGN